MQGSGLERMTTRLTARKVWLIGRWIRRGGSHRWRFKRSGGPPRPTGNLILYLDIIPLTS
jgi:hypothetical protein